MYAIATWRAATRSLVLARDPAGEKPLYIARHHQWIAFASELRALVEGGLLSPEVDRNALAMLLRLGHVPEPLCIYAGTRPLAAGTILEIDSDGRETSSSWWPEPVRDTSLTRPAEVRQAIIGAVGKATVSDVPIGIFLSGGIDSSVIAAAAHAAGSGLNALTLTTPQGSVDESATAASTARHLGMSHQVVTVNPEEALTTLPEFFGIMDQPTVDGFNSYLVCKAGRSAGLTVALSGVGGDELFRGYPSFAALERARWLRRIPDVFSMGCSLEVRSPLLSRSVISIAGALPNDRRLRGKQLLKDAFRADLPPDLLARPKQGFSLPWEHWLRTSLRQSTREILQDLSRSQGLIDPDEADQAFLDFEQGRLHWSGVWVLAALCQWAAVHLAADVVLN